MKSKRFIINISLILFLTGISARAQHYDINDFGATADGVTLNTKVIQDAIDKVSKNYGGRIVFSPGTYLTGSIELKDGVELFLEKGAVLKGSTNPYDYYKLYSVEKPVSPKKDDLSELALIMALNASNIKLTGPGTIDGQGLDLALAIDSLHHIGKRIDENYNERRKRPSETMRPKLFRLSGCKNVTVRGLQLKNSACWGLSFELCHNLILDSLKVINRAYWNNDGMDITDCQKVRVTNCDVNSADDGICLKSYYPGYSNDSIYIANCTIRSSASAIKFGSASYGGFKNITIENIKVFDTFRSAIAIESVDGALIENIRVNNIVARNTGNALFIRLGHRGGKSPGIVRNIYISNMDVEVPFGRPDEAYDLRGPEVNFFHNPFPASIVGIPSHSIENVKLEDITITYPGRATKGMAYVPVTDLDRVPEQIKEYPEFSMFGELPAWALYVRHAQEIEMKNIQLNLENKDFRPAFVFDDVNKISMQNVKIPEANKKQVVLKDVENIKSDLSETLILWMNKNTQ